MKRLIKFGLVGISNTVISVLVFNILHFLGVEIVIANTIGYICGITNSYIWNNIWVFKAKSKEASTAGKFIVINLVTWAINTGVLYILAKGIGINATIAQILATGFTMCLNFIGNKFWTFRNIAK